GLRLAGNASLPRAVPLMLAFIAQGATPVNYVIPAGSQRREAWLPRAVPLMLAFIAQGATPVNYVIPAGSPRREACRPARAAVEQVRAGYQRPDGQDAGPHCAAVAARPRRRGDRIERNRCAAYVGDWHKADISRQASRCLL